MPYTVAEELHAVQVAVAVEILSDRLDDVARYAHERHTHQLPPTPLMLQDIQTCRLLIGDLRKLLERAGRTRQP